jgi:hypothetical protein
VSVRGCSSEPATPEIPLLEKVQKQFASIQQFNGLKTDAALVKTF